MKKEEKLILYLLYTCIIIFSSCSKNEPPDKPTTPIGPSNGLTNTPYTFIASAIDPEGDSVSIQFDWGNGVTSTWSNYVISGASVAVSNVWSSVGTYQIKALAKDKKEKMSGWSTAKTIVITATVPPNTPSIPSGFSNGTVNTIYSFSSSAIDPDGDSIAIRFDWGDGYTSNWSSFVPSGQTVSVNHSWPSTGTYNITAQAKDKNNTTSNWSLPLSINITCGWTKTYGGYSYDEGFSIQQTSDGGYIIAGSTYSFGNDIYVIKTNANGDTAWTKTFGGADLDDGSSVQQTSDGGYIIAGSTYSYGAGGTDFYLIKTDISGNVSWTKTFGGANMEWAQSVRQTTDGGYIITGSTTSFGAGGNDIYLVKTDANGNVIWTKIVGEWNNEIGYDVQQTFEGGYVIVGYTSSIGAGEADVYLVKTNVNGDTIWTKTIGGSNIDFGYDVQQTADGGYIIVGETKSYGAGDYDVYLIKTDTYGNVTWTKTFGGTARDIGYSVRQTSSGGYIISGQTYSFGAGDYDVYLIKTDAVGNMSWTKTFGGTYYDGGNAVQQTSDDGYIIVGGTALYSIYNCDVYLIKTDANGNTK